MLSNGKLGFWGLTALVFGLMVGLGIFNLPQNMAKVAYPGAVMAAWLVTAAGILPLVILFKWLSEKYPQYNAGIYQYAQAGFGNMAGFFIAWGYWLSTAFSNIAFSVMLNDAFGAFFPSLMNHGIETVIFGTVFIWLMFAIVSRGIRTAKFVNNLLAAVKVAMILFIIAIFVLYFRLDLFTADFWRVTPELGDVWEQMRSTMMVTLFCFFGVEGAVMMSARARRPSDVGKAGVAGFTISLVLYLAVSLLCFGLMSRSELAELPNPSISYVLRGACGDWAYWMVMGAIIISLLGAWVSWTIVVAQVPYEAAKVKILPSVFTHVNHHGMPTFGLISSSVVMNIFLCIVVMADDVYMTALNITSLMIIPCYLFTGLFLLKVARSKLILSLSIVAVAFCVWMAYAGGLMEFMLTSCFYLVGTGFFIKARREYCPERKPVFTSTEFGFLMVLIVVAIVSVVLSLAD